MEKKSKQQQAVSDEQALARAAADQKESTRLAKLTDRHLFAEARRVAKTVKPIDAAWLIVADILNGGSRNSNDPYCLKYSGRPR